MRKIILSLGVFLGICVLAALGEGSTASAVKKYTVSPDKLPCKKKYRREATYNEKTRQYYMLRSYIEKIGRGGGGTLILKKGTYKIPCTLYLPSKITLKLKNGVKIWKTGKTGTKKLKSSPYLFQTVSAAKAEKKRKTAAYKASKNVTIQGSGTVVINMRNQKEASAIYAGHANTVSVSNIRFKNKYGGNYIWIEGSKNVTIKKCNFYKGTALSGLANQMAVRLETINSSVNTFREKWSRLDNTANKTVKISSCNFYDQEIGVGTTKHVRTGKAVIYQTGVTVTGNVFKNPVNNAIYAGCWDKPSITKNTMKRDSANGKINVYIAGYGVTNPAITGNSFKNCNYTMSFGNSVNVGQGSAYAAVASTIDTAARDRWNDNTLSSVLHYYVTVQGVRVFYFRNKTDRNFVLTVNSTPYREMYTDNASYSTKKLYFTLKSYMEQLEYAGGGTLTVEAGTYLMTNICCIPSNVTIKLKNGVLFKKSGSFYADIDLGKSMFVIVPPSKSNMTAAISGYNGSQNVTIQGEGNAVIDCCDVTNEIALVMGHAKNVVVSGITFLNEYGSHFIELNSSSNVTVKNCTFKGFKPYESKSHKECINVDGTDPIANGFSYNWSAHDRTTCRTVNIQNNVFIDVGTAVGSHTYSVSGSTQLYHENVTITGNTVDGTYNAPIRALNWRNCVIKNNVFKNTQSMDDGKDTRYVTVLLRGVINPTVTGNTFDTLIYYPIRVLQVTEANTDTTEAAGYPDTVSSVSAANRAAMKKNILKNVPEEYQYIVFRQDSSETDKKAEKEAITG